MMKNRSFLSKNLVLILSVIILIFLFVRPFSSWFPYYFLVYIIFPLFSPGTQSLLLLLLVALIVSFIQRSLTRSIAYATCIITIFPRRAGAYLRRGNLLLDREAYRAAIADFERAIALQPTATAYVRQGDAYDWLSEDEKALASYNQAITLDPSYASAYSGRAVVHWRQKKYQQAIQEYATVIEKTPLPWQASRAYEGQGVCYMNLRNNQEAISCFDQAITLQPRSSDPYLYRGIVYARLEQYQQAFEDMNRALQLNKSNMPGYVWRGIAYLAVNEPEKARQDFVRASQSHPPHSTATWCLIWLDLCAGAPDASIIQRLESLATQHTRQIEEQGMVLLCHGVIAWLQGNYEQAVKDLEQAAAVDHERWSVVFWLGITYAALGWNEEADLALSRSLELGTPPLLLIPLHRLQLKRPDFYKQYALPLLTKGEQQKNQ